MGERYDAPMCYSAQIIDAYKQYVRHWGATMSIHEFVEFYGFSFKDRRKIPKMIDQLFAHPQTEQERVIKQLIDQRNTELTTEYEQELFKQRTRLADAERKLAVKETKAAAESKRIWCSIRSGARGRP